MGEVWLAQQMEPVRRQVAVKILKAGMDSARVIARFEAERSSPRSERQKRTVSPRRTWLTRYG